MIYKENYVGFVYIWKDMKRNRFYIGSHHGAIDDGYVCSSKWFNRVYHKRPETCRRRILCYNTDVTSTKRQTHVLEQQWLDLIPVEQLGKRYFNFKRTASGGSGPKAGTKISDAGKLAISIAKRGEKNPMYGTDPYKTGSIEGLKAGWASPNGVSQRGATEEELYKAARSRSKGWFLTPDASFCSAHDAGKMYGVSNVTIINWCKKQKPYKEGFGYLPKKGIE